MRRRLRLLPGIATGACLLLAFVASKQGWHWALSGVLWLGGLAGMVWASRRDHSDWLDSSAHAAQPGLEEGSHYGRRQLTNDDSTGNFGGELGGGSD